MIDAERDTRTVSEQDLVRLKQQREQSDSRYDDALTALDQALYGLPEFPHPPPAPDEAQVTPLNARWEILRAGPSERPGWRGRLARLVWRVVQPALAEQQAFNAALVDHINRNVQPQRETVKAIESTIGVLRDQLAQLVAFHSVLLQYLQRITPFVNSKDYEFDALARRRVEDVRADLRWQHRTLQGLTAAIQGLSDEFLKHVESLVGRVHRYDARIDQAHSLAALVHQQVAALQREWRRVTVAPAPVGGQEASPDVGARTSTLAGDSPVESWKYLAFEAAFRGSADEVGWRLGTYLPIFAAARDVLDVGCGRGEFLELMRAQGIECRGLDLNFEMVEHCRARGLDVVHGDALAYLRGLPEAALGGLFAAQVVEHLMPDYLLAFLDEAHRVLRPGSAIVLETINVACWSAFFQSYIRDITHARPLHPETLKYLVTASGFADADVQFRVPVPEAGRLQRPATVVWETEGDDRDAVVALARTVDHNAQALNELLFTYLDYAIVARRA